MDIISQVYFPAQDFSVYLRHSVVILSHPSVQTERAEPCFSDPRSFYNNLFLVSSRTLWWSWDNRSRELSWNTEALCTSCSHTGPPSRLAKQVSSSCGFTGVNLSPREVLSTSCLLYGCRNSRTKSQVKVLPKLLDHYEQTYADEFLSPLWAFPQDEKTIAPLRLGLKCTMPQPQLNGLTLT